MGIENKLDRNSIEDFMSLTSLQQGMLFHYISNEHSTEYHEQLSLTITGDLKIDLLQRAWDFVIENNEMLRTVFRWKGIDKPVQIVLKKHQVLIQYIDFINERDKDEAVESIKLEDLDNRIDITKETLRIYLCKSDDYKHELIISNHHILYDGWSNGIILKELMQAYNYLYESQAIKRINKTKFSEFIKYTKNLNKDEQKDYWVNYLDDLETKEDWFYSKENRDSCKEISYKFDTVKTNKIEVFAKENKVSLAAILYSTWGVLIQKLSNSNEVLFGTTVSGRPENIKSIGNMVGLFINTIPLRVKSEDKCTFMNLICEVDATLNKRKDFENTSLVDIKEYCGLRGNEELFNSIVTIENYPLDLKLNKDNILSIENFSIIEKTNYNMSLEILTFDGLEFKFNFNSAAIDVNVVKKLGGYLENLIDTLLNKPTIQISEVDILSQDEKDQILYDFNDTKVDYPKDKTIQKLFEEQVEKTPNNVAVVFEDRELTYNELNEKANQIARILRNKGVKADSIVGIMVGRSPEMIIGIMAILKAGGAYLPIDPSYPKERIEYMLKDSESNILLTTESLLDNIEFNRQIIDLFNEGLFHGDSGNLERINSSNDLAYVIYTSGTTGTPKGVMCEHKNIVRLVKNTNYMYFEENDRILQTGSMFFDASTFEVWGALLNGIELHLHQNETIVLPELLEEVIVKNNITILWLTSELFNQVAEENVGIFKNLRCLLVGGDVLSTKYINLVRKECKNLRIINGYGPTENTTFSTTYLIEKEYSSNIPIGKPIANSKAYIADKKQRLVPVGVYGELCVSGDGLARGYLNRPELTAEKFVENPFELGTKMYKTGDLARWMPDGNIEFLGRLDNQVKIRGFRIELGEIENRLLQHEEIKEVAVVVKENKDHDKYICAYMASEKDISELNLKNYLKESLPEYMVPSYFVQVEKMPLTSNGKLDRKALPEPNKDITLNEYEAARNEVEEKLVRIWSEVLGIEKVGINDNFFDLGGHSLKATMLMSKIHKELNKEVPLKELFKSPTIKGLSKCIENAEENLYSKIEKVEEKEYYETSSAQKRMYMLQQFDKDSIAYNIPVVFELEGELDKKRIEETFKKLSIRNEALRTYFETIKGEIIQKLDESYEFRLLDKKDNEEIETIINKFVRPFELEKAPLFRVELIESKEKAYLLIDMHHIISDGVSMSILIKEFTGLYNGENLEPLKLQHKDFAAWQNNFLKSEEMEKQEDYWINMFSDEIPVLKLPYDYERPVMQSFKGDSVSFEVDEKTTEKLRKIAKQTGSTMHMVLLSAFNILLSKYSGQEDMVVGVPIAGRPHADLQNIMGMFVNTLALRNKPEGDKKYLDFLKEVRENSLKAYENQSYQFEALVEKVDVKRDTSRNPLFDVVFNMVDSITDNNIKLDDILFKQYNNGNKISKFDLILNALEDKTLKLSIDYCSKLFNQITIERLSRHFVRVLENMVDNIEIKINEIEILTEEERNQILYDFNDTKVDYPEGKTVPELFEEQVEKTPNNIAVVFEDKKLTYRELNEKVNSLARVLRNKGIGADSIVGIMVERSLEMIIGIMGILKSGGAYLSIDPSYPKERVEYMLEDSESRILLSTETLVENIEFGGEFLDLCQDDLFNGNLNNLEKISNSNNLAYVIYTSGTTGKPKGAMIEHKSLVNRLNWMQNKYALSEEDAILQKTTYTFDVSVWEILWWSLVGAKVCMLNPNDEKDPMKIIEAISNYSITTMHFVPSMLDVFLYCIEEKRNASSLYSLRQVFCSGEALNFKQVYKFYKEFGTSKKLINLYGPTEATIDVSYFNCTSNEDEKVIPIGKPIDNTKLYIFNNTKLQPIGVPGELYISGDGVARGYLNRSELTAEKFVESPLEKGIKMYKTGDLARWLPDGNIEFLGRIDNQVKIRGFRIELGEIEANLIKHEYIKNAVVLPKEDKEGNKCIAAYIETDKLNLEMIKDKKRYMLPNNMAIVSLNKNETDFMYKEIFEEQNYTKNGIEIRDGDCIFDIGANIGIFSLFISQINRDVQVYAFEPIPDLFDLLKVNTELYNKKTKVFNYGISDKNTEIEFTFYPKASIMSGKYSDYNKEKEIYTKTLINHLEIESQDKSIYANYEEIIEDRLKSVQVPCELKTLSEVIKENNVKKIDLLKIDVEKSELDVLNGIDECDWNKIKQIVLEVHDLNGQLNKVISILEKHGYQIKINTENELENTNIYNIYAVRRLNINNQICKDENNSSLRTIPILDNTVLTKSLISEFLKKHIPEYMVPTYFVQLEKFPLTTNGKLDRKALPEPTLDGNLNEYEAPRNKVEETLAKIWGEVLGIEKIGINDNFFELGGHSLKATVLMGKIHKELNKEVPLKELFKSSTIKELSKFIENAEENLYSNIEKVEEKEYYEASSAQKRMYMLQQFDKDSIAYNMPIVFELEGQINKNRIEETFESLTSRHEALRTYFEIYDNKIIQRLKNDYRFKLIKKKENTNIDDIINKFIRPFDLEKAPLFRVELVENQEKTYLLIDMHHIISDGVSMSIVIKEFTEIYNGKDLEPLKLQYKDFAAWQNEFLKSEEMKKEEEYWINRFSDEIPVLNLPYDYERQAIQSYEGNSVSFQLDEKLTESLRKLARETGTTMHMVLLSVFNILLSKYSGQEDIVVGTPIAGRPHADLQNIVGMFVNTLALRNRPKGDKKYLEFLKEVKENCLRAYENESYQLESLVEKLDIRRDTSRNLLFDVMFNSINTIDSNVIKLDQLLLKSYEIQNKMAKVDLSLTLMEELKVLELSLVYCTKIYNRDTIEVMIDDYIHILKTITITRNITINNMKLKHMEDALNNYSEVALLDDEFCL